MANEQVQIYLDLASERWEKPSHLDRSLGTYPRRKSNIRILRRHKS